MTYLKILKRMPDEHCIRPGHPVEEHLNLVTNYTDLTNGLEKEITDIREKRHQRDQFGMVSLNNKACQLER